MSELHMFMALCNTLQSKFRYYNWTHKSLPAINQQGFLALHNPSSTFFGTTAGPPMLQHAYDYRSYGEKIDLTVLTDKVTENYTGKELDDETSLNYFGARYLDPMLGVWISVDPARQRFSPYTYGSNNPISRIDPNGNADLRVAVFYNYDQYKMPVNGASMVEREISKHINPAYDKVQIRSFGSKSRAEDIVRFLNGADQAAIASHGGWDSEGIYRLGDYIEGKPDTKFISPDIATADGLVSSLSEAARYIIQGSDTYQLEQSYSVDFSPSKPAMAPDDME